MTGKRIASNPLDRRGGWMTTEFIVGMLVLLTPLLLGISEVYRLEQAARRLIMSAQEKCMVKAVRMSRNPVYQVTSEPVFVEVELMLSTRRVFPEWRETVTRLGRTYYVGCGTGRD